jgi:predicted HicB family RNase H-like nuclease
VLHVNDLITYEGDTVAELVEQFNGAVDDYLAHCREVGKQPDKPCTGSFNVRLGSDRHRRLVESAEAAGVSLNEQLCRVIDRHYTRGSKATPSASRAAAGTTAREGHAHAAT